MKELSPKELLSRLKALPSTEPTKPGAEDVRAMQARSDQMEILFWMARRDQAGPGLQGTYTGLAGDAPF